MKMMTGPSEIDKVIGGWNWAREIANENRNCNINLFRKLKLA